jgi:parallel beta-helix repeat protein/predicted outer membrane repeat protein
LASTLSINTNLTIDASALPGGLQINGNHLVQIINLASGATNVLNSLTLVNGFISGYGGGIENTGTLTLTKCILSGNSAYNGGGIYNNGNYFNDGNHGTLTLNQCTLSGNNAYTNGGGIYNIGDNGTLTLNQCTLSGNIVSNGEGGGIYTSGGAPRLNQSTLSGNRASGNVYGDGGGIYILDSEGMIMNQCTFSGNTSTGAGGGIENIFGTLTLNECTVSGNSTGDDGGGIFSSGLIRLNECTLCLNKAGINGGGIYNYNYGSLATVIMTNTIIDGNTAGSGSDIFSYKGTLNYSSSNLVRLVDNDGGSISGPAPLTSAPGLAPLGNYGGPTQTMPPLPYSSAIGAGSLADNTFATDQRGYPRTQNGLMDLGAMELPRVPLFTASPTNNWQSNPVQFTATNVDSDGSAIVRWNWGFGDTKTSVAQNPAHAYAATGILSISLIVTNSLGLALRVTGPSITILPPLRLTGLSFSASDLLLSGANGASGLTYFVLVSTNPALPLGQWTPLTTNTWNANGAFSLALRNALNLSNPQQFYLLKAP